MGRLFYCSLCKRLTQYPDIKRELKLLLCFLQEGKKPQLVFCALSYGFSWYILCSGDMQFPYECSLSFRSTFSKVWRVQISLLLLHLLWQLYTVGLFDGDPTCRFCRKETETVQHIICCCEALARQSYNVFWETACRTKRYKYSLSKKPVPLYKRHRVTEFY